MTNLLQFGSDVGLRNRLFERASFSHPAKLHLGLLQWIVSRYTRPGETIADPMAGIGGVLLAATEGRNVIAREIEPRWVEIMQRNAERVRAQSLFCDTIDIAQADAREAWGYQADHIIFSPPYSCSVGRTAVAKGFLSYLEHKEATLQAQGIEYTRRWASLLHKAQEQGGAAGAMIFVYGQHDGQLGHLRGASYWLEMSKVYGRAHEALRDEGYMILIIKDHIRDGKRVMVCDRTVSLCQEIGFTLMERHARLVYPLSLWQRRHKERGEPVVEDEQTLIFTRTPRRPAVTTMPTSFQGYSYHDKAQPLRARLEDAIERYTAKVGYAPTVALVAPGEAVEVGEGEGALSGVEIYERAYVPMGNIQLGHGSGVGGVT